MLTITRRKFVENVKQALASLDVCNSLNAICRLGVYDLFSRRGRSGHGALQQHRAVKADKLTYCYFKSSTSTTSKMYFTHAGVVSNPLMKFRTV